MLKEERMREALSLTRGMAIVGTIWVSLVTWCLLFPEDLTGISHILIGLALLLSVVPLVSLLALYGALSPTGLTSKLQADSLRRQAMKREPSSPHVDLREYGKPPSANQD